MSLTPEERQEIINAACEKALLMLPEVVGSLMAQHAALMDMNRDFYKAHPEFAAHKPIVQAVLAQIEGSRPTDTYEDILKAAAPIIQDRIAVQAGLDMTTVRRPDRHLPGLAQTPPIERDPSKPLGEL